VFEAGSVSKQFTAAAIVLLSLDGKLSLDDDVRKYVPEVPDYGVTIRIHHLLNHTSGLRDWGSVAGIGGWPRTTRAYTHAHVLDIVSRQRALNYPPGQEYSYTNTGYNLLAVIVDRVSGMPFAEFTRQRLFKPLNMNNTQWRDDFTRVVKGRAIGYQPRGTAFVQDMPFENVHGNGGLLTTVGDLLIWTENLETGRLGGRAFLEAMHRQGVLTNGNKISYASGLMVGQYNGKPEISHTGSTAGYRAYLSRLPDQRLGFAVLCNAANANPGTLGNQLTALYAGAPTARAAATDAERPAQERPTPVQLNAEQLAAYAGEYYSPDAEVTFTVVAENDRLIVKRRPDTRFVLMPTTTDTFQAGLGTIRFIRDSSGKITELSIRQARVYDLRFSRR
jgi:CubicO group peptidase (beta-lactamase class C family)